MNEYNATNILSSINNKTDTNLQSLFCALKFLQEMYPSAFISHTLSCSSTLSVSLFLSFILCSFILCINYLFLSHYFFDHFQPLSIYFLFLKRDGTSCFYENPFCKLYHIIYFFCLLSEHSKWADTKPPTDFCHNCAPQFNLKSQKQGSLKFQDAHTNLSNHFTFLSFQNILILYCYSRMLLSRNEFVSLFFIKSLKCG